MNLFEENAAVWRLIGRCEFYLKCKKRGPRRRGLPPLADRSCRARTTNSALWCGICRLRADIDNAVRS